MIKQMTATVHQFGKSSLGQPLWALICGTGKKTLLITSALHGDEIEGVILGSYLWAEIQKISSKTGWKIVWIPIYNPDGFALGQRWSSTGVDLNRNFPTKKWNPVASNLRYPPGKYPASEPETRAFVRFVKKLKPQLILDLHSFKKSAVLLDFPETLTSLDRLAKKFAKDLKVPAKRGGLGYEEYGCAYQWVNELGIPSMTLEVKRNLPRELIEKKYLKQSIKFIKKCLLIF